MSNRDKSVLYAVGIALISMLLNELGRASELQVLRYAAFIIIACATSSSVLLRWPKFIGEYFDAVVKSDNQRGIISIYNFGLLTLVSAPVLLYMLFSSNQ